MPSAVQVEQDISISQRSVDEIRPLKVIVIGAGISGILAGIKLPQRLGKLDLVIYDKNEELGGTWFENKYPGCACDIPAHCYQLSFESNPAWSSFYASASEILDYWKCIADKYDLRKYMRLSHKVEEARWDEAPGKWRVKLRNLKTDERFEDEADVLMQAVGGLNDWKWPDIKGLHDFKGKLLHSAVWDESFEYNDKRIAVIGAGSSGIQITPSLQPHVTKLDQYIRGKTWISNQFVENDVVKKKGAAGGNFTFSQEEIDTWQSDPHKYLAYRRTLEWDLQSAHGATFKGSEEQKAAREAFTKLMKDRLAKKAEITPHILPDFAPICKRLTPGPGFLEALTEDNVEVIPTPIDHVDATGIVDIHGTHRPVDAIVCATGFDTTFTRRFPCIGRGGKLLSERWQPYPSTYLSLAVDDFPNFFVSLGPNSALGSGNLLLLIEGVVEYVATCCAKLQREHIRAMAPTTRAVAGFERFCKTYFKRTVFSDRCSSWYKGGKEEGDVLALWPGSSLHAAKALENPRWEDFEYQYFEEAENGGETAWLGDGWSVLDRDSALDRTYYLSRNVSMLHYPRGVMVDSAKVDEVVNQAIEGKQK